MLAVGWSLPSPLFKCPFSLSPCSFPSRRGVGRGTLNRSRWVYRGFGCREADLQGWLREASSPLYVTDASSYDLPKPFAAPISLFSRLPACRPDPTASLPLQLPNRALPPGTAGWRSRGRRKVPVTICQDHITFPLLRKLPRKDRLTSQHHARRGNTARGSRAVRPVNQQRHSDRSRSRRRTQVYPITRSR